MTSADLFGDDEEAPAPVIIPGSPSENSATSDDENRPSSVKPNVQRLPVSGLPCSRNYGLFNIFEKFHRGPGVPKA